MRIRHLCAIEVLCRKAAVQIYIALSLKWYRQPLLRYYIISVFPLVLRIKFLSFGQFQLCVVKRGGRFAGTIVLVWKCLRGWCVMLLKPFHQVVLTIY